MGYFSNLAIDIEEALFQGATGSRILCPGLNLVQSLDSKHRVAVAHQRSSQGYGCLDGSSPARL
jgi:hypothetical protein